MPNQKLPQVRARKTIAEAVAASEAAQQVLDTLAQQPPDEPLPDDWFEAPAVKEPPSTLVDRYKLGAFAHQPDVRSQLMKKKGHAINWDEDEVIAAIKKYNGNLVMAAQMLGASRSALDTYRQSNPAVNAVCQEEWESKLDNTESVLYNRAMRGEGWAVTFLLKTQGRGRGYIERGETMNIELNLNKLSDEQLRRIANGEHPAVVMGSASASRTPGAPAGPDDGRVIEGQAELLLDAPAETETGA
jgi:hypothetical protein